LKPANEFITKTEKEIEEATQNDHFNSIETAHPDYKTHRDSGKITEWIQSKPAYLQKGMLEVCKSGTAEEVISLLNDFKTENDIPLTNDPPPPNNVVKIDKAKEERKAALTPPTSKRGAINTNLKPADDYDGAFEEATSK